MFYIKAKVLIKVEGISGPFEKFVSYLVTANSANEAKTKYETKVRQDHANMVPQTVTFDYLEVTPQI